MYKYFSEFDHLANELECIGVAVGVLHSAMKDKESPPRPNDIPPLCDQ